MSSNPHEAFLLSPSYVFLPQIFTCGVASASRSISYLLSIYFLSAVGPFHGFHLVAGVQRSANGSYLVSVSLSVSIICRKHAARKLSWKDMYLRSLISNMTFKNDSEAAWWPPRPFTSFTYFERFSDQSGKLSAAYTITSFRAGQIPEIWNSELLGKPA